MNKLTRLLLPLGIGVVAVVVGLFVGRLLRGAPDPEPADATPADSPPASNN